MSTLLNTNITSLQCLVIGGEKPNKFVTSKLISSGVRIFQEYGLTESSIVSTYSRLNLTTKIANIGSPISNIKCYVLSSFALTPLPIGIVGELYIGGVGLARGYLNRPDLTEERFIPNPFQTEEEKLERSYGDNGKNSRLYKTGDLVRWLPDGNLEYIGRNDFQVKIRGYRIELGEIESALSSCHGVKQCVVLAMEHKVGGSESSSDNTTRASSSKYLVGYYISDSSSKLDEESILSDLQTKLPDYMIPSALVHLKDLPITANGKIDKKALPDPEFGSGAGSESYIPPRSELESKLCAIWAEVLGLDSSIVGIRDDFFRLGGDSIVSIQVVSRLRQKLGFSFVSVKDIFSHRTIERLFDNVIQQSLGSDNGGDSSGIAIDTEQGLLAGELSLLPIQQLVL